MITTKRAQALTAFKVLVSLVLLGALALRIPLSELYDVLRSFPMSGLVFGMLMLVLQLLMGAQRWRRLLQRMGVIIPISSLIKHTLVASAYTMILPSSVGGDVIRAARCGRQLEAPQHAWSTVLFERMIGFPCMN